MLDNVVFFERASSNAMHERGAVVSDGSKAILVLRARKAADAIYLTLRCLVVMEPLAKNIELLLPLRDCRQVYCHFEKVFQRTSENVAPPSRSPCRAVAKRMRAQIRKLLLLVAARYKGAVKKNRTNSHKKRMLLVQFFFTAPLRYQQ